MASLAALIDALAERIVVLDGATATVLQGQFDRTQPVDRLCLTEPARIVALHRAYVGAGAEILSTNSFNAADLPDGEEIARAAAALARAAADAGDRPRWVAGVLGPTAKSASLAIDGYATDFDTLHAGYLAAARGLMAGGADLLLIETVFDALNAKAAIHAVRELDPTIPLLISATVTDASGRLPTGQDLEAFWIALAHAAPLAVGLNCAFGAEALRPHLQTLARVAAGVPILVYPNAGLPDAFGRFGDGPESMARTLAGFAEEGLVNIVGGCCGTTPAHIAALAEAVKRFAPRPAIPLVPTTG
jgi:5-methyltetrahydrofolate--homocysteine methyltransferase